MSTDETTNNDLTPDIRKLELNDTLYTWFTTTNQLIEYVNPIQLYNISLGSGFTETRLNGTVNINLNLGKGIKLFPEEGNGDLTLDIENLYSSLATVRDSDYVLFERADTGNTNFLFSVNASDILPPTINDDHEFMGMITVDSLNTRQSKINLSYGATSTSTTSGLVVRPGSTGEKSFLYRTTTDAWETSSNFLIGRQYSFLSSNTKKDAYFRFATNGNQYDVVLELAMGMLSTTGDDHSWRIEGRHYLNRLDFIYNTSATTDVDHTIFSARIDNPNTASSTFVIYDKIEIGNIAESTTNFKEQTDYTQYKIPVSNSDGILDKKWVNRYVTSDYVNISVGDLVKIYDNTNSDTYITRCVLSDTTSDESETYTFGIVERISGGKAYIVMLGEFNLSTTPSPALEPGLTYYLTTGSPNFTKTKPTKGLIKPVFVATGAASGVIFPMITNGLSFGQISVSAAGGLETGYLVGSGSSVYSNTSNGGLNLVAGNGITLETDSTNRKVTIRALTQGNEPGYSKIKGDSGDSIITAITPFDTLRITGGGGGINVALDENTDNDQVILTGKYFRTISIAGDETNADFSTITADVDAGLTLYGGVGIRLTNPSANLIRIEATGDLAATIADYSLTLKQIQKQPKNSVVVTKPTTGSLSELTALQATTPSLLMYNGLNNIVWSTPYNLFSYYVAQGAAPTGTIVPTSYRFLGISIHTAGSTTPIGGTNGTAAFFASSVKPNGIDNIRMGLIQGDGIILSVVNNATSADWVGVPAIKISNSDTTSKFRNVVITNTNETIAADVSGVLKLTSPSGSPISLDADSNSDTVYFNVSNGTITNNHLAEMPDNTVKVGLGDTSNTPTDLLIQTNSVLGRLSGEIQSLNASNLRTILGLSGSNYFSGLLTDSGSVYSTETETLAVRGGPGISVTVGTDNEILITNTVPGVGDGGITVVGTRSRPSFSPFGNLYNYTDGVTGINKVYFGIGDIKCSFDKSGTSGVVVQQISWDTLGKPLDFTVNTVDDGVGLMYAGIIGGEAFITKFSQVGNGKIGWQIPYFDMDTQELSYFSNDAGVNAGFRGGPSGSNYFYVTFDNDGRLMKTNEFVRQVTSYTSGLNISPRYQTQFVEPGQSDPSDWVIFTGTTDQLTSLHFKADNGCYWSSSAMVRMEDDGRNFVLASSQSLANFTVLSKLRFAHDLSLDSTTDPDLYRPQYTTLSDTDISVKTFSSNWYQLSTSKICMPTFMVGTGPTNSTATTSNGYLIRNDSTNNALVFTNYNLNSYGSRTTSKDRSSRLSLEVMNADAGTTQYYSTLKSTGSMTHTYVDVANTPGLVDSITISGRKSVKYLIQATNSSDKVFTSEFLVQANTTTNYCNYIQYASVSEPAGFSLDITATLNGTTLTVSNNSVAAGVTLSSLKVMKLEI